MFVRPNREDQQTTHSSARLRVEPTMGSQRQNSKATELHPPQSKCRAEGTPSQSGGHDDRRYLWTAPIPRLVIEPKIGAHSCVISD